MRMPPPQRSPLTSRSGKQVEPLSPRSPGRVMISKSAKTTGRPSATDAHTAHASGHLPTASSQKLRAAAKRESGVTVFVVAEARSGHADPATARIPAITACKMSKTPFFCNDVGLP